ncbi:DUF883 family protein [Pelagibacterium montanilacus]|uniref:DUF883 family protein n=1 Tax=Pelagibacterium montanilacus TaxID=2185280 RepID=UPI000F8C91DE|nr:DUF883 family protein [Pelagibacterium montanilacus]
MARAETSTRTTSAQRDPAKDLDAEIAALREDVSAITATLGDIVKYRGNSAREEADRVRRKAVKKGEETLDSVNENLEHAEDELKTAIREKPLTSVLIAAGVGYLLSKILRV